MPPNHAVLVDGALIPIRHLVNDSTVTQIKRNAITYYHIGLPRHDVILADRLLAESYLDAARATHSPLAATGYNSIPTSRRRLRPSLECGRGGGGA